MYDVRKGDAEVGASRSAAERRASRDCVIRLSITGGANGRNDRQRGCRALRRNDRQRLPAFRWPFNFSGVIACRRESTIFHMLLLLLLLAAAAASLSSPPLPSAPLALSDRAQHRGSVCTLVVIVAAVYFHAAGGLFARSLLRRINGQTVIKRSLS